MKSAHPLLKLPQQFNHQQKGRKMKVRFLFLSLFLSLPSWASLPETGSYQGSAQWMGMSGSQGQYEVSVTIKDHSIESHYQYDGQSYTLKLDLGFDKHGFFKVMIDGMEVGSGYCAGIQCHYSLETLAPGAQEVEETLTFVENRLYRIGSKGTGEGKVAWNEALERK